MPNLKFVSGECFGTKEGKFVSGECFGTKEGIEGQPGNRKKRDYSVLCKTDGGILYAVDIEVSIIIFIYRL